MVRQSESTNVWKHICAVLSTLAPPNGLLGCHSQNIGTIPVFTLLFRLHLFRLSMGMLQIIFGIAPTSAEPVPELSDWLEQRNLMNNPLKQHLQCAQQRMKSQADKNRSERPFSVGESVYLKLQPYIQTSVIPRSNNKLSFKFFGPYEILEKIGPVAYKLQLPSTSVIHPAFHVSQLKKAPGKDSPIFPDLPPTDLPCRYLSRSCSADWSLAALKLYFKFLCNGLVLLSLCVLGKMMNS